MPDPLAALSAFIKAWAIVTIALTVLVAVVAVSRMDPAVFRHAVP